MFISSFSGCNRLTEIEFPTLNIDSIHSRLCIKLQTFLGGFLHPAYTLSCYYNPSTKEFYVGMLCINFYPHNSDESLPSAETISNIIETKLSECLDIKILKIITSTTLVFKLSKKKEQEVLMTLKILGY